jgi:protein-tyrosine phosphatase
MFGNLFNRKNREKEHTGDGGLGEFGDWSFLGADMHSHFIPGIDDGAPTMEASIELVRGMVEMGYTTLVTTPHVMVDFYPNTTEKILDGLGVLRNALQAEGIGIEVRAAAEYFIDEYFTERLAKRDLLPIVDQQVLVEFSMYSEPPMLKEVLFKMMTMGYRPIMAHPERYNYYHNHLDTYLEFKDRGCLFQLNALSVSGYYGKGVQRVAEELLQRGMYDYCGSDVHHDRHIAGMKAMMKNKAFRTISSYPFLNKKLCF